jgi:DNA primase
VGFSGRVLSGDEKTAKYVNSPETPIFTKGKILFGLDKSKRALLEAHRAVICEGQLDLIACFMAGVKNVVAPQGTALTGDHVRILKRYVEEVVLCFDSDEAGQKAAVRSLDTLLASGLAIRVAAVPAPHDPDSFIKEFGGPAFAQLIENARGFFDYYLDRLCVLNDATSDRGRRAIARGMAEAVQKTGSEVLSDTYAQKTALRLGVAMDAMRLEFSKGFRAPTSESDETEEGGPETPALSKQEAWLLRLLLESDTHVEWVAAHLELEWVPNPVAREIVARRLRVTGQWPGVAAWLAQLENPQWQSVVTECLTDSRPVPVEANLKGSETHSGLIKRLRDDYIQRQLAAISQQLMAPDLPEAGQRELMDRQQHLRQLKRQPLTPKSDQA